MTSQGKGLPYSRAYVEITNVCNRDCSFCPGTTRAPKFMSCEEMSHIISELSGLTEYVYFHVMGEPLLHPELPQLIRIASECGIKCAITTNGTLLREHGNALIESGVYKVNLSVHSFEEGTYQEQLDYVRSVVDFADKASAAGILTVIRLWNLGHDGGRNRETLKILHERFSDEWQEGARGARIRHRLHLEYGERFAWPDAEADYLGDEVFCYGLRDHFGILSDGTVVPCCLDREGTINLGNVFDTPLTEILSSDRAVSMCRGFDTRVAVEELCKRCGYARRFK